MPENWKSYKLSEIVDQNRGISYGIVQPGNHDLEGIPILKVNNLTNKSFDLKDLHFVSKKVEAKYKRTKLRGGEILLSLVGTLGEVFTVPENLVGLNVVRALAVIPVIDDYSPVWVEYYLKSPKIQERLKQIATTSVQATINLKELREVEISFPEKIERETITSILSAIDDKIENNLAMNKTLEDMAMALYKHWFVDFGPFQERNFIDSELGLIPEGWEIKKFGDFIEKIIDNRGKTPPISEVKTNYLLLETYQLTRDTLFPKYTQESKAKYVSKEIYNNNKWFRKGHPKFMDILFATVGNGIPNWSFMYENEGVGIAQNVVAIRTKLFISPIFLRYSFESKAFLSQFDGYVITTAQPSIKLSDLNMIDMILPPEDILINWIKIVNNLVKQVYTNYNENQTLIKLRDSLLPKLISGEVRLKEFEKEITAAL